MNTLAKMFEIGGYNVPLDVWREQFLPEPMRLQRRTRLDRIGRFIAHKDIIKKLRVGEAVTLQVTCVGDYVFDTTALKRLKMICGL